MATAPHRSTEQPERRHMGPTENRGRNKQWTDLFRNTNKTSSTFQLRNWSVEERVLAKEDLRNIGFCLLGQVLGRFPGRNAVEDLMKTWNVESSYSIHENGWLIFRFCCDCDRESVLRKGPYESFGAPWLLKKLPPFFKLTDISFNSVPTWIRLRGLPLECWTEVALGKLASFVGEPLAADDCTATLSRSSFARILVEVDISRPLVREIRTSLPDGSLLVQEVIFEREPRLCVKCKRIGHNEEQCRSLSKRHQLANAYPLASTQEGEMVMQMPGHSGAAGNLAGKKKKMLTAGGAGGLLSYPKHANKKQQDEASSSSAAVAESVTTPSAMVKQQMVDMQGALPTTPAKQQVAGRGYSVGQPSSGELADLRGADSWPPAAPHPTQDTQLQNQLDGMQATYSPAACMANVLVSQPPAMKEQQLGDLQGGQASYPANSSVAKPMQNLRYKSAMQQLGEYHATQLSPCASASQPVVVTTVSQQIPDQAVESQQVRLKASNSAYGKAKVIQSVPSLAMDNAVQVAAFEPRSSSLQQQQQHQGQQQQHRQQQQQQLQKQQQQQQVDESGNSRMLTRSASAIRMHHKSAADQQQGVEELDTSDLTQPADVLADQAQGKWETRKTRKGKKRR